MGDTQVIRFVSQRQVRLDGVNGVIQENLTGIRLIRVFVRMGHEIGRFASFSGELMKSTVAALRLTETTAPLIMLIVNAGIMAVLWFGRIEISAGEATQDRPWRSLTTLCGR